MRKIFRTDFADEDAEDGNPDESKEKSIQCWAKNNLAMTEEKREELARRVWGVETYHQRLGVQL